MRERLEYLRVRVQVHLQIHVYRYINKLNIRAIRVAICELEIPLDPLTYLN